NVIMGNPKYEVTDGEVWFKGENILEYSPDRRARMRLFLAFQYPMSIPGVSDANFLRRALEAVREGNKPLEEGEQPTGKMNKRRSIPPREFRTLLQEKMRLLRVDNSFINRSINDGFSGGEKKRAEILQMALLEPEVAIMDETDSGLDIDALKVVSESVNALTGPNLGVLLITHYQRMLNYITPDFVHVMFDERTPVPRGRLGGLGTLGVISNFQFQQLSPYVPASQSGTLPAAIEQSFQEGLINERSGLIVQLNGTVVRTELSKELKQQGVI